MTHRNTKRDLRGLGRAPALSAASRRKLVIYIGLEHRREIWARDWKLLVCGYWMKTRRQGHQD